MPDIIHRVGIKAKPQAIYDAITRQDGLSNWWTRNTKADTKVGGTIQFRFGSGGPDVKIIELHPNEKVQWEVTAGMQEWIGTKMTFVLTPDSTNNQQTYVSFKHSDWKNASDHMTQCSTKWAVFLLSLKSYLETGKGQPYPEDIQISVG